MLAEKSRRQFELDELLDINKGNENVMSDEAEFESEEIDSKDNESNKRKSMSEVIKSIGKYKTENTKDVQDVNSIIER